ncbi:hypothetical protein GCM10009654_64040 [Streptomyces hebeiensis]|uniref:Sensory transduction protein RegX3 n=2 Tax=Streptomyces hebeiensis TaxID=229486 RepID=A0ABP4FVQ7_9ACTN
MTLRTLLIEDDETIAEPLVEGLGRYGLTVHHVSTGAAGLSGPYGDIVLLDLGLPDMDGIDVCRGIRQVSDVPIIMLTARGTEADRVLGLELGADDYLAKPFSVRELIARIRAVTRRTAAWANTGQAPLQGQTPPLRGQGRQQAVGTPPHGTPVGGTPPQGTPAMDSGAFGGTQAAIGVEVTGTFPSRPPSPRAGPRPPGPAAPGRPPPARGWGDPGQGVGQGYGPGYGHDFGPGYGPPGPGAGPGFGPAPVTEAPEARATREPRATQPGSEAARESGQRRRRKQTPGAESGPGTSTGTGTRTGTGTGTASSAGQDASSPTGALVVDRRTRQVWVGETPVSLTPKEFDLLALLTEDPGAVYSRQQILDRVWDPNFHGPTKTLDVHVATLRRKLGNPAWIQTLRGVGLRLAVRVPASSAESPSGSPSATPSASGMYTDSGSYAGSGTYSGSGTYTGSDYREKRAG